MCKEEKGLTLNELIEQIEPYSEEDSQEDTIENLVDVKIDNLNGNELELKSFKEGLKEISKIAGMICGLKAVGISESGAIEIVATQISVEQAKELQIMNNASAEKIVALQNENI